MVISSESITNSDNRGWLAFYATTDEAEYLLKTEFQGFEDSLTGCIMPACDEYHVPHQIKEHNDFIAPGIKLLAPIDIKAKVKRKNMRRIVNKNRSWPRNPNFPKMLEYYLSLP
ncbi:hypothetical protein UA08_06657 [Talaromyces atroroseus]|uniref:Peptidase S53 activation domain-containing protein n=1 Tax=Talaromyces atroroseus TaxID=1441469 RepID=A0A225ASZ5_TALAT|nr:hypothetical protein UA08_06657 [Talaromyces atroroseus]OKL58076.1 hypothetical protein UA08_06657 [Talaromyces atroroseus]